MSVTEEEKKYVIEKSFCQTIISVTEKITFRKQVTITKTSFCQRFCPKNHIFVTEEEGQTVAKKSLCPKKSSAKDKSFC